MRRDLRRKFDEAMRLLKEIEAEIDKPYTETWSESEGTTTHSSDGSSSSSSTTRGTTTTRSTSEPEEPKDW